MSCEVRVPHFPDHLGCIVVEGYIGTVFRKTKYLGGVNELTKMPIVDAKLIIDEAEYEREFLKWWRDDLENGVMPFYVEMKFFGITHHMEFLFISHINEVLTSGYRENPIKLELMNYAHVLERPDYIYELVCDTSILCDDQFICT